MTKEQWDLLHLAAVHFHQDFDLDDWAERDVFAAYARGLKDLQREAFCTALEALLQEHLEEADLSRAWGGLGAHWTPSTQEVKAFVAWARTPAGRKAISSPGPTVSYDVARVDLSIASD